MAVQTITSNINVDDIASGNWRSNDSLVINNGATVTVNTNQERFWSGITINNGKLRIENTSTTTPLVFAVGRVSGTTAPSITPSSSLGSIEVVGNWIEIGEGTGAAGQTLTIPYNHHVAGIWVETAAGSGVYNRWVNCLYNIRSGGEWLFEGLNGYGHGDKGNVFKQHINPSPAFHSVFTNSTISSGSRLITVSDTTGIFPGAGVVGSSGITANSVVERVVDATTIEINLPATVNSSTVTITVFNTYECWTTNQISVGDGINGNVIPVGAKVRIPNILLTAHVNINIATGNSGLNINLTNGGSLTTDKCLFAFSNNTFTNPQTLHIRNTGFSFNQNVNKSYGTIYDNVIFSVVPKYPFLTSGRFQENYAPTNSATSAVVQFNYVSGSFEGISLVIAAIANVSATASGAIGFAYADGIVVDDISVLATRTPSGYAIALQYVYRSALSNIKAHGLPPFILYASSSNTIDGVSFSMSSRGDYTIPSFTQNSLNLAGFNPATGLDLTDNTPYYVKLVRRGTFIASDDMMIGKEICVVPYTSSNPDFFNEIGFYPGDGQVVINWDTRLPTHNSPAYEIFRSETEGVPVRDVTTRIYVTNSTTTTTYTDNSVANGTTYYYVLRKYYSSGVYEDSPVWDVIPSSIGEANNYLLQSKSFNNAQWVKSNVTVPSTANTPGISGAFWLTTALLTRRLQPTANNATITNTVSGLTIGQTYTASAWVRYSGSAANATTASVTTPMRLTFGTATLDFDATETWTRYSVTFTATATSHPFILRFDVNGAWVDVDNCQVNTGATPHPSIETTTAQILTPTWDLTAIRALSYPQSSSHNAGFYVNVPTWNINSGHTYSALHLGTSRGFTPTTDTELIVSDSALDMFYLNITSSENVIKNVNQVGKGRYSRSVFSVIGSSSDNLFDVFNLDLGNTGYYTSAPTAPVFRLATDSNRNLFRNMTIKNTVPYISQSKPLYLTNDCVGTVMQNIRLEPYNTSVDALNNGMLLKGFGGADSYNADNASFWNLGSGADGVSITFTGVYDTHFAEMYHSETTGALNLFFTASTSEFPPYTITGGAKFSGTGLLYLQNAGDSIEYTWPHKIYGVSGFRNIPIKVYQNDLGVSGQTGIESLQSLLVEIKIDEGSWIEATPANLSAIIVSAEDGFNLKLRLTARQFFNYSSQTNSFLIGETIRHVAGGGTATVIADYNLGTSGCCVVDNVVGNWTTNTAVVRDSDSEARANVSYVNSLALGPSFNSYIRGFQIFTNIDQTVNYPLPRTLLEVTGFISGSDVVIYDATIPATGDGSNVLASGNDLSGSFVFDYDGTPQVRIGVFKSGYVPFVSPVINLTSSNSSYSVQQRTDLNYA